jgi:hypothetical protein
MDNALQILIRHALNDPAKFTIQTIAEAHKESDQKQAAEFLRLPKPGTLCPVTDLTRSYINMLVLPSKENNFKPPVKSFTLRKRGQQKGVRLIDRADLIRYIHEHVEPTYEPPSKFSGQQRSCPQPPDHDSPSDDEIAG